MQFPSKEQVERVRQEYPKGTRIEVTAINDPYSNSKLTVGSFGTADFVDDTGTLFCYFDNGEYIGLLYGVGRYRKVTTFSDKVFEQVLELRKLYDCPNMFDVHAVQRLAFENEFYELVDFIETNRRAYSRLILTGERG
jgi:hypothetical protein